MELIFNSDTKHRKDWFTGISFSHPAKMILPLQIWIIDNYTQLGDIILDPMAGSGTILVGCSMGRNVICVELEKKFCDIINGNWGKVQQRGPQLGYSMGWAEIRQGDARNLEGVLCDAIITSLAYGSNPGTPSLGSVNKDNWGKQGGDIVKRRGLEKGYSNNPENVNNLPYGKLDAVITSPPYEGTEARDRSKEDSWREDDPKYPRRGDTNISAGYGKVEAIITSPPYEGSVDAGSGGIDWDKAGRPDKAIPSPNKHHVGFGVGEFRYSNTPENIGNLKSDSYLSAMLQIYQSCYAVLRSGGVMVLVVKPFIRNKQIVPLDEDTKKICVKAGFTFVEEHYRRLTAQSFWRTIYAQRYPDAPTIDRENILIFRKGGE